MIGMVIGSILVRNILSLPNITLKNKFSRIAVLLLWFNVVLWLKLLHNECLLFLEHLSPFGGFCELQLRSLQMLICKLCKNFKSSLKNSRIMAISKRKKHKQVRILFVTVNTFLESKFNPMACLKLVLNFNCVLGSIHSLEGGVGRRNPGECLFCFFLPKRWVTINFTASRGRVTFFWQKNIKGDFCIHAHRDSSSPPPPPLLKNECSLLSKN